jgi:PTH1 family peptidyl-tRNA hydrolase
VVAEVTIGAARVALAVPTTFMNESGAAVRPLVRRFGLEDLGHLVVVHDELDLPPGRLKVKVGGGTAGHNGLRSLQSHLHDTDFVRVRIGVGKPPDPSRGADHVLRRPSAAERELLAVSVALAADAVEVIVSEGAAAAMNRFNIEP